MDAARLGRETRGGLDRFTALEAESGLSKGPKRPGPKRQHQSWYQYPCKFHVSYGKYTIYGAYGI